MVRGHQYGVVVCAGNQNELWYGMVRIINIGKGSSMLWVAIMLCIRIKAMHYSHNRGR